MASPQRPKFLNLLQLSYPPGAIASIAHRVHLSPSRAIERIRARLLAGGI